MRRLATAFVASVFMLAAKLLCLRGAGNRPADRASARLSSRLSWLRIGGLSSRYRPAESSGWLPTIGSLYDTAMAAGPEAFSDWNGLSIYQLSVAWLVAN